MIITKRQNFNFDFVLLNTSRALWGFCFLCCVLWVVHYTSGPATEEARRETNRPFASPFQEHYSAIGSGPLAFGLRVEPRHLSPLSDLEEQEVESLSLARWWGVDLLFQKYGGDEFRDYGHKQKIVFLGSNPYFLFVEEGDYLHWHEGRWRSVAQEEAGSFSSIAQVKEVHDGQMKIEWWNEKGGAFQLVELTQEKPVSWPLKMETLPSAFRYRSSQQVTCLFGKRRVILKQGDWLIKTGSKWRVLSTLEDVENYLNNKIIGELFVFDSLHFDDNNITLKGTLFSETRTQSHPISMPIAKEKKRNANKHKKKRVLSKRDLVLSPSQLYEGG